MTAVWGFPQGWQRGKEKREMQAAVPFPLGMSGPHAQTRPSPDLGVQTSPLAFSCSPRSLQSPSRPRAGAGSPALALKPPLLPWLDVPKGGRSSHTQLAAHPRHRVLVKSVTLTGLPGVRPKLHNFPAVWPQASHIASLSLGFPVLPCRVVVAFRESLDEKHHGSAGCAVGAQSVSAVTGDGWPRGST